MTNFRNNQSGFTMVELIVSIFVGGIFALAITTLVTTHSYLSQKSRNLMLSNAFVEGKVEALRSVGYLGINTGTTDISSELPVEITPPRAAFLVVAGQGNGIKRVTLLVSFNDQGALRTYTYTSLIGELGVGQY